MKKNTLDFWLDEYYRKFGDYFPTENFSCSESEMIDEIKKCIKMGATFGELDVKPPNIKY